MDVPGPLMTERYEGAHVVLVPLKSFDDAKGRLGEVLDAPARRRLAERLAVGVLTAGSAWHRIVVTSDTDVVAWATSRGLDVVSTTGTGLSGDVGEAYDHCVQGGARRVTVVPGDLARPAGLQDVVEGRADGRPDVAVIVPDRLGDGTNVLSLPPVDGFRFRYGPGSASAHRDEATRHHLDVVTVIDGRLGWDVDVPEDLTGVDVDPDPGLDTDPGDTL